MAFIQLLEILILTASITKKIYVTLHPNLLIITTVPDVFPSGKTCK